MQFKKGSFEVGGAIWPVAIKYDVKFGEAFWNSSKYSMLTYIYMMMTSWAIVCDVWYLPPMHKKEVIFENLWQSSIKRKIYKLNFKMSSTLLLIIKFYREKMP